VPRCMARAVPGRGDQLHSCQREHRPYPDTGPRRTRQLRVLRQTIITFERRVPIGCRSPHVYGLNGLKRPLGNTRPTIVNCATPRNFLPVGRRLGTDHAAPADFYLSRRYPEAGTGGVQTDGPCVHLSCCCYPLLPVSPSFWASCFAVSLVAVAVCSATCCTWCIVSCAVSCAFCTTLSRAWPIT